jgi:hypothetical protein
VARDLPSLAIPLTLLAFNFLGDGLRDALDHREGATREAEPRTPPAIDKAS